MHVGEGETLLEKDSEKRRTLRTSRVSKMKTEVSGRQSMHSENFTHHDHHMWILSPSFILFKVSNAILASLMIGVNIEYMTFTETRKMKYPLVIADGFLWLVFAGEMCVRINHHRGDFFKNRNFA